MSASATVPYTPIPWDAARRRRHRILVEIGAVAVIVGAMFLLAHGLPYYIMPAAQRVVSPHHAELKPAGSLGRALGIAGTVILVLVYLYPLRKRWAWLARKGQTRNWLDYHILMGLSGPALITFHSAFKLQGVAGMAYWSMIAVVLSGVAGRYLYNRIPRKLGEVEMSIDEMERLRADLTSQLESQDLVSRGELDRLLVLPSSSAVRELPLRKALWLLVAFDARRWAAMWRLRLRAPVHTRNHRELCAVLRVVRKQAALSRDALFLGRIRRLFHLWHIIHRPFSYALAIFALLHISVVTFFGF